MHCCKGLELLCHAPISAKMNGLMHSSPFFWDIIECRLRYCNDVYALCFIFCKLGFGIILIFVFGGLLKLSSFWVGLSLKQKSCIHIMWPPYSCLIVFFFLSYTVLNNGIILDIIVSQIDDFSGCNFQKRVFGPISCPLVMDLLPDSLCLVTVWIHQRMVFWSS